MSQGCSYSITKATSLFQAVESKKTIPASRAPVIPTSDQRSDIVDGVLIGDADKRAAQAIGTKYNWDEIALGTPILNSSLKSHVFTAGLVEDKDDVSELFLTITVEPSSRDCQLRRDIARACPVYIRYGTSRVF